MVKKSASPRFCLALILFFTSSAAAQTSILTPALTTEGAIPSPAETGTLGRRDAAALSELQAHLAATGGVSWTGLQGTGTITYGDQTSPAYEATLSNLGADRFRLDTQDAKGSTSTRIDGPVGVLQDSHGQNYSLSTDEAMFGIFPFQLMRSLKLSSQMSLIDQGTITVGSQSLHRVSLERASAGHGSRPHSTATKAVDFYFDTTTHLLVKSVAYLPAYGSRPIYLLRVITYSDYRTVGNVLVPFRFSESIEGAHSRTLQLNTIQLDPKLDPTYFRF